MNPGFPKPWTSWMPCCRNDLPGAEAPGPNRESAEGNPGTAQKGRFPIDLIPIFVGVPKTGGVI